MNSHDDACSVRAQLAMSLVSAAIILFEVSVTRIMSVITWYHFAFLSVSLAMLGIGAPGVWFSFRKPSKHSLELSLLVSALALPLASAAMLTVGAHFTDEALVILSTMCMLVPMLGLGAASCLFIMSAPGESVGRMYAANLAGAGAGAVCVVLLQYVIATPVLIALLGLLPAVSAFLLNRRLLYRTVGFILVLFLLVAWGRPFEVGDALKIAHRGYREKILWSRWTPTSYVTIHEKPKSLAVMAWGLGDRAPKKYVEQLLLKLDGDALTPIERLTGRPSELEHLFYDVSSVGYQLVKPESVCIIGGGGGRDIVTALASGASSVAAVEINAAIVGALQGPFREFSGDIYRRRGVSAVIDEGRSYLTRCGKSFDMIQISMIDSWAATSAGAFAFTEVYLYTEEAFILYLKRLNREGVLSVSRWSSMGHYLEASRMALLGLEALRRTGVKEPRRHILLARGEGVTTMLLSKAPFGRQKLALFRSICCKRGFHIDWPYSGDPGKMSFAAFAVAGGRNFLQATAKSGLSMAPPTDDKPFFFYMLPLFSTGISKLAGPRMSADWDNLSFNTQSIVLLRWLLGFVCLLTVLCFFLPLLKSSIQRSDRCFWTACTYFLLIGVAFMLVELPWLQKLVLFLGHPSYATTVVLASLLLGAGLGSTVAGRLGADRIRKTAWLVAPALACLVLLSSRITIAAIGMGFGARVLMTISFVFPAGILMGMPFPLGLMFFGEDNKPWYWAVNGAASVLASVLSLAFALATGFETVMIAGITAYLLSGILIRRCDCPN